MFSSALINRKGRAGNLHTAEGDITLPSLSGDGAGDLEVKNRFTAYGGTKTVVGDYTYHTFTTTPDDFEVAVAGKGDILLVGGGGAGGLDGGVGGDAGEVIYETDVDFEKGDYIIYLGRGGIPTTAGSENGTVTRLSFDGLDKFSANGGAAGSSDNYLDDPSSGGAGAGGAASGGNGGIGLQIFGDYYGGGGGGGGDMSPGTGGSSIGGNGGDGTGQPTSGVDNTGSGGGGWAPFTTATGSWGSGGSGKIIIRYLTPEKVVHVTGEIVNLPIPTVSGTGTSIVSPYVPHDGSSSITLPSMTASGTGRTVFKFSTHTYLVQTSPHYYRQDLFTIFEGSRWDSASVNVSIRRASDDALMANLGNTVANGTTGTTFTWFDSKGTYTYTTPAGLMTFQGPHYSRAAYTQGVLYHTVFTINGVAYRRGWQLN